MAHVDISAPPLRERECGKTLVLFDVDGTLAVPAQLADAETVEMLAKLRRKYAVGIVGAGDFEKQQRQLGGHDMKKQFDCVFSENGVHAFRDGELIHCKSIIDQVGKENWKTFDQELDELLLSTKEEAAGLLKIASPEADISERGTFLEKRMCTVNICAIGRTPKLTQAERGAFEKADKSAGFRVRLVKQLTEKFGPETKYGLKFSIGGQIGIDVCPNGWDKTFCLQFVDKEEFPVIHFFGDKTHEGGGDFEIFSHERTIGYTVKDAADTVQQVNSVFFGAQETGSPAKKQKT